MTYDTSKQSSPQSSPQIKLEMHRHPTPVLNSWSRTRRISLTALSLLPLTMGSAHAADRLASPAPVSRQLDLEALQLRSESAGDSLRFHENEYGMPRYLSGVLSDPIRANITPEAQARNFLAAHPKLFPLDTTQLQLTRTIRDEVGGTHLRFEQIVNGIPVLNARLVLHLDVDGVVRGANSSAVPKVTTPSIPSVTSDAVVAMVQDLAGNRDVNVVESTLVYYPTRLHTYLTWQTAVITDVGPRILWIDAQSGKLIAADNPLRDAATTGTGIDVFGNTVTGLDMVDSPVFRAEVSNLFRPYVMAAQRGKYNLVDLSSTAEGKIYTYTSNQTYLADIDYVNSRDNSFDDTSNHNHPAGVSAHQYYRQTLDFYKTVFNRNGIDDNGLSISAVVEVNGLPDYPLECNAGWLGYGYNFMIFGMGGDCFGYQTYPFSGSLDVIGHELNHGVNEFTINLGYNHEAGALNESFADVFGILDESWNEEPDWLIGEDLFIDPQDPNLCFRSFSNPASESALIPQPDHMNVYFSAPVSYDAGGVHFNSGIINKAFYLVVEGDTFNGVTVPPMGNNADEGRAIAGDIWYAVMKNELISNVSQFVDVRDALIDTAQLTYPNAVDSLEAAFLAVGVVNDLYPTSSQDRAEPNDYPGQAMMLSLEATTSQYIWSRNDADIYALDLTAGQSVTISLTNLQFDAMLSVYNVGLYDTLEVQAESNNEGTASESLEFNPVTGGTFYVEVVPYYSEGSRSAKYDLLVHRN